MVHRSANAIEGIVLSSLTDKIVKEVGKETVASAMSLAADAVVTAIRQSIIDLGFNRTGQLLRSVRVQQPVTETMATVIFEGGRLKDNRTNAQVAYYLDEKFGLIDYAEYEAPAIAIWRTTLGKARKANNNA